MAKKRLDTLVQEHFPTLSKTQIQSYIMQGKVQVDGATLTKPGTSVAEDALITLEIEEPKFVCRAGFKLEKALDHFNINVNGLTILDAGLSTGGFTDCLLQRGAKKVFGIDVGYGQVHEKIRSHNRVVVMERTNLRHIETLGELVDMVTLDLSFISILKVMDAINKVLKPHGILVTLIKPQFEAEKHQVGKKGIIKDPHIHEEVTQKVIAGIEQFGYKCQGMIESPILGGSGNKEFLAYFLKNI